MKHTKNILAFLLAALLLVSCSENAAGSNETQQNTNGDLQGSENSSDTVAEEPELTSSVIIRERFGDKNYEGQEFRMLGLEAGSHYYTNIASTFQEIYAEEYNGEIINDAIYDRNAQTEELLNITFVPLWASGADDLNTKLKQSVSSATDDFDAALQSLQYLGTSLQNGELANLKNFATIDTSSPWYDKNSVDTFTLFGDKLYWLTGDYMLCDDYAVHAIYFNKNLVTNAGQELPYDSVREGSWTIDRFYNMVKSAELDVNGDGRMIIGKDIVPHVENHDKIKHWIYGSGEKSIEINDDKTLTVNTLNERHINVVQRLYEYTVEKQMTYSQNDDATLQNAFKSGLAVSYCIGLAQTNIFRDMKDDFGIVPIPKYDEEQESYGSYISNFVVTGLCSPLTVKDREFTGVCLETLSALSTDTVNAALFDTLLKSKLIRDQETVEMLQICFDTKMYDWAVDFSWGSTFGSTYNNVYDKKAFNYVSEATKSLKIQQKNLDRLIEKISEFED